MKTFYLPDLGEGLAEAEIHEWYVQEGDTLATDQPMVAMETAKAIVDIPAPFAGKIFKRYGQPGDIIKTHAPLVEFDHEDAATVVGNLATEAIVIAEPTTKSTSTRPAAKQAKALPVVRMLARQMQVDLAQVVGTGKDGSVTADDVMRAAKNLAGAENLKGMRRTMAQTMSQAHSQVVAVTIHEDADIHAWADNCDITARVIRGIVKACQTEPSLNAWFDGATLQRQLLQPIHIGLAMDTQDGLFVPVLQDVAKLAPDMLRKQIDALKTRVQMRTVTASELQGASFVLSNFGVFAGRYATPIVVPPTVAILATGSLRNAVVACEGQAVVHKILPLSLSFDHRAITGGEATRFMAALLKDLQTAD
jgi:2-oxoisovalerate dehydrogenase E2 component (dihydrolipoyl transacylase)